MVMGGMGSLSSFDDAGINRKALAAHDRAAATEARRLENTRPRDPRKRFPATEEGQAAFDKWLASLPRGDRVICNVIVVPDKRKPHRKPYHAVRVVDRKIWAKLDGPARQRYIERIREEVIGA